jgi:hypothetical protein
LIFVIAPAFRVCSPTKGAETLLLYVSVLFRSVGNSCWRFGEWSCWFWAVEIIKRFPPLWGRVQASPLQYQRFFRPDCRLRRRGAVASAYSPTTGSPKHIGNVRWATDRRAFLVNSVGASRQLERSTHWQNQNAQCRRSRQHLPRSGADWNAGVPPASVHNRTEQV